MTSNIGCQSHSCVPVELGTSSIVQGFLQLTPKQRKELVALRVACLSTLSDVIDERNNIHAFLTV